MLLKSGVPILGLLYDILIRADLGDMLCFELNSLLPINNTTQAISAKGRYRALAPATICLCSTQLLLNPV